MNNDLGYLEQAGATLNDYGDKSFTKIVEDVDRELDAARRVRNILSAIDNLMTQMDGHDSEAPIVRDLRAMRSVYEFEDDYYKSRS